MRDYAPSVTRPVRGRAGKGSEMTLGPYELNTIITGDARELAKAIPDESVDLIFTDPVYDRIDDYRWLAETAARVLKPDAACLSWYGIGLLDLSIEAMKIGGLLYRWDFSLFTTGTGRFVGKNLKCFKSGCLWFDKNKTSEPLYFVWDVQTGVTKSSINSHGWAKDESAIGNWMSAFTPVGAIVFDPFTGGGTVPAVCKMLGRNYLAFEIDPDTAERARERVANTQPPLFVPQHEQLELTP